MPLRERVVSSEVNALINEELWVARSLQLMGMMIGKFSRHKCRELLLNSIY
jgi:hypothetical protein